jgi:hypothetical protein
MPRKQVDKGKRRDSGVGSPDLADSGNQQSTRPGGTPAQGNADRSGQNRQSADLPAGGLQSGQSRNPHNRQTGRGRLSEDDLDLDESS